MFFTISVCWANQSEFIKLNDRQQTWLKNHPLVTIGGSPDWTPFNFVDKKGQYSGIANDYLQLISQKTGLKFKIIIDQWSHNLEKIHKQKIDVLPAVYYTEERDQYLIFSKPYFDVLDYFFVRNDLQVKTFADLDGLRVAIPKGYAHIKLIEKYFPKIDIVTVDTFGDTIDAVLEKRADLLYDTYGALIYTLEKEGINTIVPFKSSRDIVGTNPIHMVTRKDAPVLASIIEKGLEAISATEKRVIYQKWLGINPRPHNFLDMLNPEQKTWLKNHSHLYFAGLQSRLPYEHFNRQGEHIGIVADFLQGIQQKLAVKIEPIPYQTQEQLADLMTHGRVHILAASKTGHLQAGFLLTRPFVAGPIVIVMRNNENYVESLEEIRNRKLAVIKDYGYLEAIEKNHPEIVFNHMNSIEEGLTAVSIGKVDAVLMTLAQAGYYIAKLGINNIRIVGKSGYDAELVFAIHKDLAPLRTIIDQVLQGMSQTEKRQIFTRWGKPQYAERTNYGAIVKIGLLFLLILLIILYWLRKLSAEINRRKMLEAQLIAAKENAETANRSKSIFLANMSHEIRTPMNAILGFSELLEEQLDDPKLKGFVKSIRSAGKNLLVLINDILDLSRIEAGKLQIEKTAYDPHDLFNDIANIFAVKIQEKGLEFKLEIAPCIPPGLMLDAVRLRQILFNLIGNAVKFTEQGYISLQVKAENEDEIHSQVDLVIVVEDTGIGISEENRKLVFLAFEQPEGQDQKKFGGTGLGLAISKRLVEILGGTLELQTQLGKGSRFIIKLKGVDIASCYGEQQYRFKAIDWQFATGKILLVDDVDDNRRLIKAILAETALQVYEAENGWEAINQARQQEFDLILMDIRMPEMDGYQSTREIKKITQAPVVALTASIKSGKQDLSLFDGYLYKPIQISTLFDEMKRFLPVVLNEPIKPEHTQAVADVCFAENEQKWIVPLLEQLTALQKQCKVAEQQNNIAQINAFSNELEAVLTEYPVTTIKDYAQQLKSAIASFDVMEIKRLLNDFHKRVHQLKVALEK